MAIITFICDQCKKQLSAGDDLIGGQVQCPFCQTVLQVPQDQPAIAPEQQVSGQAVSDMYHHARLDYESGGWAFGVLCTEVLLVAGGFGLWAQSAWVFGGLLVLLFVVLFKLERAAKVLGIVLGVAGGALLGVSIFCISEGSLSAAIVGGSLTATILVAVNLGAVRWART